MDEQAARDIDLDDRAMVSRGVGQLHPDDRRAQRRNDRVVADLAGQALHRVESVERNTHDLPGLVVDTQHEHSIP